MIFVLTLPHPYDCQKIPRKAIFWRDKKCKLYDRDCPGRGDDLGEFRRSRLRPPEEDEDEMIAKNLLRCAANLLLGTALLCPSLRAQDQINFSTADEEIISTALPENQLAFNAFAPALEGLAGPGSDPAVQPLRPTPVLTRPGFWSTAENSLFAASLISFAGLNVADYFLTREAMKYPETVETNPLMRPIVKNALTFALVKAGYIALNTFGLIGIHNSDKPMAWALSLATDVLATLAVTHNLRQLDKVKGR